MTTPAQTATGRIGPMAIGKIERRTCLNEVGRCFRCRMDIGYGNPEIVVPHWNGEGMGYLFCNDCFIDSVSPAPALGRDELRERRYLVPTFDRSVDGLAFTEGSFRDVIVSIVLDKIWGLNDRDDFGRVMPRLAGEVADAVLAVLPSPGAVPESVVEAISLAVEALSAEIEFDCISVDCGPKSKTFQESSEKLRLARDEITSEVMASLKSWLERRGAGER